MAGRQRKSSQFTKVNKNGCFDVMLEKIYGVDFSGAKSAGKNCWVAECHLRKDGLLECVELKSLEEHSGSSDRKEAMAKLVEMVCSSENAIWGFDFPFSFPTGVLPQSTWHSQFEFLEQFGDDAKQCGLEFVKLTKQISEKRIRRLTETESRTPFDSYHYRIIYQTFFGMRLLLDPLRNDESTAILPFQYDKFGGIKDAQSKRILVETCPSSFLKKHNLPHQNYKETMNDTLTAKQKSVRKTILKETSNYVYWGEEITKICMRNPGGDALDAVLAAIGTWQGFLSADHEAITKHPRYPLEGYMYV